MNILKIDFSMITLCVNKAVNKKLPIATDECPDGHDLN